jgi:hypothetical protein
VKRRNESSTPPETPLPKHPDAAPDVDVDDVDTLDDEPVELDDESVGVDASPSFGTPLAAQLAELSGAHRSLQQELDERLSDLTAATSATAARLAAIEEALAVIVAGETSILDLLRTNDPSGERERNTSAIDRIQRRVDLLHQALLGEIPDD